MSTPRTSLFADIMEWYLDKRDTRPNLSIKKEGPLFGGIQYLFSLDNGVELQAGFSDLLFSVCIHNLHVLISDKKKQTIEMCPTLPIQECGTHMPFRHKKAYDTMCKVADQTVHLLSALNFIQGQKEEVDLQLSKTFGPSSRMQTQVVAVYSDSDVKDFLAERASVESRTHPSEEAKQEAFDEAFLELERIESLQIGLVNPFTTAVVPLEILDTALPNNTSEGIAQQFIESIGKESSRVLSAAPLQISMAQRFQANIASAKVPVKV